MAKTNKVKARFQGSIKACRHPVFEQRYSPAKIVWSSSDNEFSGEMTPACLTKPLKKFLTKLKVKMNVIQGDSIELKDAIPGLPTEIIADGQHHVRIKFESDTESGFVYTKGLIQEFLEENGISYENYCLYVCVTGPKQAELTEKYLLDLEKIQQ